jgi:hypothetical protein
VISGLCHQIFAQVLLESSKQSAATFSDAFDDDDGGGQLTERQNKNDEIFDPNSRVIACVVTNC